VHDLQAVPADAFGVPGEAQGQRRAAVVDGHRHGGVRALQIEDVRAVAVPVGVGDQLAHHEEHLAVGPVVDLGAPLGPELVEEVRGEAAGLGDASRFTGVVGRPP
jgi:hypothetical protein